MSAESRVPLGAEEASPAGAPPAGNGVPRWPPALLAVLVLAGLARLHGLGREGLWNDEVLSIVMSRGSFSEVLAAVRSDVHPPLHFLLCWLWQPVAGRSEWLWRLPSALCGIAAVGVTWRLGARLASRRAALVASVLATTSTMAIYYSQETRSYALLLLLTLVALDRTLAWEESRRTVDAVLLALSVTLLLYTHYFGALALLVFGVSTAMRLAVSPRSMGGAPAKGPDWRGLATFGVTQAVALVAFAPWIWWVADSSTRVRNDFWLPSPEPHWVPLTFAIFTGVARPVWGGSRITWSEIGFGLAVTLPLVATFVRLAPRARTMHRDAPAAADPDPRRASNVALLVAWLVVPTAIAYGVSQGPLHVYSHRNLIVSLPAWWLLAATLIDRLPGAAARALAIGLVLAPAVSGASWYYGTSHKEQWRELAAEVARGLQPGDHVSIEDAWLVQVFRFHLGDRAYRPLPLLSPAAIAEVHRLWVIRGPSQRPNHLERVNRELAVLQMSGFRVVSMKRFVGAELILLERTPGQARSPDRGPPR